MADSPIHEGKRSWPNKKNSTNDTRNSKIRDGDMKPLKRITKELVGDKSKLTGDCSRLSGNCSQLSGDCSDLYGNLNEIPLDQRKEHPNLNDWVEGSET